MLGTKVFELSRGYNATFDNVDNDTLNCLENETDSELINTIKVALRFNREFPDHAWHVQNNAWAMAAFAMLSKRRLMRTYFPGALKEN